MKTSGQGFKGVRARVQDKRSGVKAQIGRREPGSWGIGKKKTARG
jgi:hypothetical protein